MQLAIYQVMQYSARVCCVQSAQDFLRGMGKRSLKSFLFENFYLSYSNILAS